MSELLYVPVAIFDALIPRRYPYVVPLHYVSPSNAL